MTMTPQERDVIAGIFDRLKPAASQPRDPEAEKLIADRLKDQPYAPYAMAQSVYVQEQALANLQSQVETLQAQLADMQRAAQAQAPQQGGFLSGIFGGGAKPAAPAMQAAPAAQARPSGAWGNAAPQQAGGPWGGQPQQAAPAAGGGFMATALTTAAGVAGGMVVGNMLMNAFSGGHGAGSHSSGTSQANNSASAASEPASQTAALSDQSSGTNEAASGYSEASYEEPEADYGSDSGGDDWA
jgi:uncharacterized protein